MMKKMFALLLTLAMVLALAACGQKAETPAASTTPEAKPAEEPAKATVYAVEAGSAGEAVAQENGYEINSVASQADALMEVQAGTSDAAIIDSLMAGAMVGEGTSYDSLTYTVSLNAEEGEQYGVGFRQGSDLAQALNDFFAASYADGSMVECAETYGIQAALIAQ